MLSQARGIIYSMPRRFSLCFFIVALTLGAAELAGQPSPAVQRIVAIGDIHGSADGLAAILVAAGIADSTGKWRGGNARLIQTGDYTDRGEKVRDVLDTLMRLESEAPRAGGRAQILLGNHEAMNLLHEFRDVSPPTFAAFADSRSEDRRRRAYGEYADVVKRRGATPLGEQEWLATHPPGFIEYVEALSPRGRYGRWLRNRKVLTVEAATLFMHAGVPLEFAGSLEDINRTASRELEGWDRTRAMLVETGLIRPFFTLQETLEAIGSEFERITRALDAKKPPGDHVTREFVDQLQAAAAIGTSSLLDPAGPLWFRGFAQLSDEEEPKITALLKRFDLKRSVTAHTPMLPGKIAPRFGGRGFLIDTGMLSSYYKGGQPSALEIVGDRVTAIYTTGREVLQESSIVNR